MTNIDIANGLVFQALGVSKDAFDDRLLTQKKVFLLQELGVNLGYAYNWYVRGPYSPDLTAYVYNNLDVLKEQDFSRYRISDDAQKQIDTVNAFANEKPDSLSVSSWYELLASVLYIQKRWNKDDAYDSLVKYKPQYTREHFDAAVNRLRLSGCCA